jgi:hypothetical protein
MAGRARRALAIALVGAVGIIAALALTAAFLISQELAPDRLSARLSELSGRPVSVASTSLQLFPFPSIRAGNVRVGEALSARRVELDPSILELARGRLRFARIRLEHPSISLLRTADGTLGLSDAEPDEGNADIDVDLDSLPRIEVKGGRVTFRDEAVTPPAVSDLRVERLKLHRELLSRELHIDAEAGLGSDGTMGLISLRGELGETPHLTLTLRAVDAEAIRAHLPSGWDVRSATGVLEGRVDATPGKLGVAADFELALRGGGAVLSGVRVAGQTRLAARGLFAGTGEFSLSAAHLEVEAIEAQNAKATGLVADFDYHDHALEITSLQLGTVAAGIEAAAALGLPGAESVPVEIRVEEAGRLAMRGEFDLPDPDDPAGQRSLSLPGLEARGTRIAVVHDPGPEETVALVLLERFDLSGYATGETVTLDLEGQVLGDQPGLVSAKGRLGPLESGRPLLDHPYQLEAKLLSVPASHLLPYVPEAWPVPEQLGTLDLELEAERSQGAEMTGTAQLASRIGEGGLVTARAALHSAGEERRAGWPITFEVEASAFEAALIAPALRERFDIGASGLVTAKALLHARPDGDIEGDLEIALPEGRLQIGELELSGGVDASGRLARIKQLLAFPRLTLRAGDVVFRDLHGTDLHARGIVLPPAIQIEAATVRAFGGELEAAGSVVPGSPLRFDLDIAAHDLDSSQLIGPGPEGERARNPNRVDGVATLRGQAQPGPNWMEPIEGGGEIHVNGGAVDGMPLRQAIANALIWVVPGSGLVMGNRQLPRTMLESSTIPFAFEGDRVRIDGLEAVTPDYHLRANGHVAQDGSYSFDGDVSLTSDGLAHTLSLISAPRVLQRTISFPAIPVDFTGSFADDREADVSVDLTEIPISTARGLLGLPLRAGNAARTAAERGLGALQPRKRGSPEKTSEDPPGSGGSSSK